MDYTAGVWGLFNIKGGNIFFLHRGEDFFTGKVLKPGVQTASRCVNIPKCWQAWLERGWQGGLVTANCSRAVSAARCSVVEKRDV